MDIESAIEFLLQQAAQQQAWSEAQQARFDAQQAQFRGDFEDRQKGYEERHDREMAAIRAELRRGVRLAVEEARRERKRRQEEDAKLAATDEKLAASHAALEETVSRFIASLKQPLNGDQT